MPTLLVQVTPHDPVAAATATLRLSSGGAGEVAHTGGLVWWPVIADGGRLGQALADPAFTGKLGTPTGEVAFDPSPYPLAPRFVWGDAPVTVYVGEPGDAWPWPVFFSGVVSEANFADNRVSLALRGDDAWLDQPMLATYLGTGGAEGPADLKGRVKPLALGAPRYVEPVLIDAVKSIYQFHGYGPAKAVTAALERLIRFGAPSGDFASLATLSAATLAPGTWATCLVQGLVRFGAPPVGTITLLVEGDNGGADGWARTPGRIIARLAAVAGIASARTDTANLAALDTAVPYPISRYWNEQVSVGDAIADVAGSVDAAAGIGLGGRLFVSRMRTGGAPALTLRCDGTGLPQTAPAKLLGTSAPYWRMHLGYQPTWRVHGAGEAAQSVEIGQTAGSVDYAGQVSGAKPPVDATRNVPRGVYGAGTAYAPGDQVILSGSSYQALVATTGNPPPDATRWVLVASAGSGPAGADGAPGYSVVVTNEFTGVATAADGSGGDYSGAGGTMRLQQGNTILSGVAFSVAARTPTSAWITINATTGVYTVTDPGVDSGTATLRATFGGVSYDRTVQVVRNKQGVAGPTLRLTADATGFLFVDGAASPAAQTITLAATVQGGGTVTFAADPAVTLGGSGSTRTLTLAAFGGNRQVTITATSGALTDRLTLLRLDSSTAAAGATVGGTLGVNLRLPDGSVAPADRFDNDAGDFSISDLAITWTGRPGRTRTITPLARAGINIQFAGGATATDARMDNYLQPWTQVQGRPSNIAGLSGSEAILNAGISVGANGLLVGAGGGQVTIGGLGYAGDLDAQRNSRIAITGGKLRGIGAGVDTDVDNLLLAPSITGAGQTADWAGAWASTPRGKLNGVQEGATVSDNLIANGWFDSAAGTFDGWLTQGVTTSTYAAAGSPRPSGPRMAPSATAQYLLWSARLNAPPSRTVWVGMWLFSSATDATIRFGCQCFDVAGAQTGDFPLYQFTHPGGGWRWVEGPLTIPATISAFRPYCERISGGTSDLYMTGFRCASPQSGATFGARTGAGGNLAKSSGSFWAEPELDNAQQLWGQVSGTGRPVDYATRNSDGANMIPAPDDPATWTYSGGGIYVRRAASGRPAELNAVEMQANGAAGIWGAFVPVRPGEVLYYTHAVIANAAVPGTHNARGGINYLDAAGSALAAQDVPGSAVAGSECVGAYVTRTGSAVVPASAAFARPYVIRSGGPGGSLYAGEPVLGRHDPGATVGATWGGNLTGRPAELIDGRVATALKSNGNLASSRRTGAGLSKGIAAAYDIEPLSATAGVIDIAAHGVRDDAGTLSFSASSISGLASGVKYGVYEDNPNAVGGARSYVATTALFDIIGADRRFLGSVFVPAAGGGTVPGGPGGSPNPRGNLP